MAPSFFRLSKIGMAPETDMFGQFKPKMPSKGILSNPVSNRLIQKGWSVLTRSPICGREECSHLQIHEAGLGQGWSALPIDPQRRIEAGLCLWWPTDGQTKLGGEFGFHLRDTVNFKTSCPSVSQTGLLASVQVARPRVKPGPTGATLWTKQLRARQPSLWHHCDLMAGMDCILCNVLWILHLSRKTETKNAILFAGFYEIIALGIHFQGYVYISVSAYERERERGGQLKYFRGGRPQVYQTRQGCLE